jgi:hypothetical protein
MRARRLPGPVPANLYRRSGANASRERLPSLSTEPRAFRAYRAALSAAPNARLGLGHRPPSEAQTACVRASEGASWASVHARPGTGHRPLSEAQTAPAEPRAPAARLPSRAFRAACVPALRRRRLPRTTAEPVCRAARPVEASLTTTAIHVTAMGPGLGRRIDPADPAGSVRASSRFE